MNTHTPSFSLTDILTATGGHASGFTADAADLFNRPEMPLVEIMDDLSNARTFFRQANANRPTVSP